MTGGEAGIRTSCLSTTWLEPIFNGVPPTVLPPISAEAVGFEPAGVSQVID
jgi:hypothetical protein